MVKAGALYYAVFVAFIIILISGFFILSSYFTRQNLDYYLKRDQLKSNVESGYVLASDNIDLVDLNTEKEIKLYEDENVFITKGIWGLYYILNVKSTWKNQFENSKALIGLDIFKTEKTSLYLTDLNNSLSISGNTFIRGLCYLPKQLVKRAYIEGRSYSGSELIYGEQKLSNQALPAYNEQLIQKNLVYLKGTFNKNDSVVFFENFSKQKEIYNSFYNKTLVLISFVNTQLIDKKIKGNIILYSPNEIIIDSGSELDNLLIYARKIIIKKWYEGNIQAFASDTIIIENNCKIQYPGSLVLYHTKKSPVMFEIYENSIISGDILVINMEKIDRDPSIFKIHKKVVINGQVYTNVTMMHQGTIVGSLYLQKFILKTLSSVYENHLLDATIDFNDLDKHFASSGILDNTKKAKIIKYLE